MLIIIVPMPLFEITFWPVGEKPGIAETGVRMLHDLARTCSRSAPPGPAEAPPLPPASVLGSPVCETFMDSMDAWMSLCRKTNVDVQALQIYGVDYSPRYGASLRHDRLGRLMQLQAATSRAEAAEQMCVRFGCLLKLPLLSTSCPWPCSPAAGLAGYDHLYQQYRSNEVQWAAYGNGGGNTTLSFAGVVMRELARTEAGLNIVRTVFICFILMLGSQQLSRDSERFVMRPLRHIVAIVNNMSDNPLLTGLRGLRDVAQRARGGMKTAATAPHLMLEPPAKWKLFLFRFFPKARRAVERVPPSPPVVVGADAAKRLGLLGGCGGRAPQ